LIKQVDSRLGGLGILLLTADATLTPFTGRTASAYLLPAGAYEGRLAPAG
jgi:hypothetical protein